LTNKISKETDFQLFLLESIDIEQLIIKIFQNKIQKPISIIPMKEIMKTLKAKIPVCSRRRLLFKRVRFCLFSGTENGIYLRVESKRRGN
jgi:hypothetical protein